ncbi:hypothetical protein [Bombella intestini]|uniref:hypothetical protein n=1 Tax=Bombella intestini TaxID=1539051 RepID=UPI0009874890|nr:hypothetical protein [Bombella intestini]
MRVWTRVHQPDGRRVWKAVTGDQGNIAWLQNALLLQLGESPFWADWGIPVQQTLVSRVWPDYYLNLTQRRFRDIFPSLQITRKDGGNGADPVYDISVILNNGTLYSSARQSFNQDYSQTGPWS